MSRKLPSMSTNAVMWTGATIRKPRTAEYAANVIGALIRKQITSVTTNRLPTTFDVNRSRRLVTGGVLAAMVGTSPPATSTDPERLLLSSIRITAVLD